MKDRDFAAVIQLGSGVCVLFPDREVATLFHYRKKPVAWSDVFKLNILDILKLQLVGVLQSNNRLQIFQIMDIESLTLSSVSDQSSVIFLDVFFVVFPKRKTILTRQNISSHTILRKQHK